MNRFEIDIPQIFEDYIAMYKENDGEAVETPTRELAEAWLDVMIDLLRKMYQTEKYYNCPLIWGKVENGSHENCVNMGCVVGGYQKPILADPECLQVHTGIDKMSKLLDVKLIRRPFTRDYKWSYYFMYKGVMVFQISNEDFEGSEDEK